METLLSFDRKSPCLTEIEFTELKFSINGSILLTSRCISAKMMLFCRNAVKTQWYLFWSDNTEKPSDSTELDGFCYLF